MDAATETARPTAGGLLLRVEKLTTEHDRQKTERSDPTGAGAGEGHNRSSEPQPRWSEVLHDGGSGSSGSRLSALPPAYCPGHGVGPRPHRGSQAACPFDVSASVTGPDPVPTFGQTAAAYVLQRRPPTSHRLPRDAHQ